MSEELSLEEKFRAVSLAYDIAVGSYDVLAKRVESIDGRLQTMLTLCASVGVAVLAIVTRLNLNFQSSWFYLAITFMGSAVIVAVIARLDGAVDVLDPSKLNTDKWLACSEWEFKNLIIQAAAVAFANNKEIVDRKWRGTVIVIITFLLGAACLTAWATQTTTNV